MSTSKSAAKYKIENIIFHNVDEIKEVLQQDNPHPVFENYDDFQMLVARQMQIAEKNLVFSAQIFILIQDKAYLFNKKMDSFSLLDKGNYSVYKKLEDIFIKNLQILNIYINEVERLESSLFNRKPPHYFMDLWFDLKRDLAKAENYYYRFSLVFREFIKKSTHFINDLTDEYNDIEDSIQFQTSSINTLEERLSGLHNYYESLKNDKLNNTLLVLTLISGVFLPLNLIVGFFGMNTQGMFLNNDLNATVKVVWLLFLVVVVCLSGLKILRTLNDHLLKYIVGKNRFYKRLSNKIESIDNQLKGR